LAQETLDSAELFSWKDQPSQLKVRIFSSAAFKPAAFKLHMLLPQGMILPVHSKK
jgi:hypothetical protein